MTDSKRSWWSLRHTSAKGLGSSWSWAAKSQVQHEREAVSLSLLKLCSRTLTNKELLLFQIHGNPEQPAHVTSREENFFFFKDMFAQALSISISVFPNSELSLRSSLRACQWQLGKTGVPDWPPCLALAGSDTQGRYQQCYSLPSRPSAAIPPRCKGTHV